VLPPCVSCAPDCEAPAPSVEEDPDKAMAKMREMPINDFMTHDGKLRIDGRVVRDIYLFEVKKPEESKAPWDYYRLVQKIPAAEACRPLDQGGCPLVTSASK